MINLSLASLILIIIGSVMTGLFIGIHFAIKRIEKIS